jgi:hypothetical protein
VFEMPPHQEELMSRVRSVTAAALVGLLAVAGMTGRAAAQATASITAMAAVTGYAPLTAAGVNNLDFGAVTAGTPKAPTSLSANAGRFNLSGQVSTPVTVTFTLPTVLSNGGNTIPVTFATTDGLLWTTYPTTHTTFNPNAPFFTTTDGSGNLVIGISGTVSPPLATTTGTYTGTVTLTVSY